MAEAVVLALSLAVLVVAFVSERIEKTALTVPIVVVVIGAIGGSLAEMDVAMRGGELVFLEITLALVLFSDATRIDLTSLRMRSGWPGRMLVIGLPLAIVFGALVGAWLMGLTVGFALLLGVILAPTDAALAEPVLVADALPSRIRQTLNVESGLNDGLALPALFVALALIEAEEGIRIGSNLLLLARELGIGLLGGVAFGAGGAWLFGWAVGRGWMSPPYLKIAVPTLALATFAATQMSGGSGFVAAFVAGAVFAHRCRITGRQIFDFAQNESTVLVVIAFLFFGAGPVRQLLSVPPDGVVWLVALASLFLVRPLAVYLSLVGQEMSLGTKAFFGWFGPRGLASIVFLLTAAEEVAAPPAAVVQAVYLTVAISVLLHGVSAYRASVALGRSIQSRGDLKMAEMQETTMSPMRRMRPTG